MKTWAKQSDATPCKGKAGTWDGSCFALNSTSNAMQCNAMQCNPMLRHAKQWKAMQTMQSNVKQYKAMQSNAKQCKTMQRNAKQCRAIQSNAKHQCKAIQSLSLSPSPSFCNLFLACLSLVLRLSRTKRKPPNWGRAGLIVSDRWLGKRHDSLLMPNRRATPADPIMA